MKGRHRPRVSSYFQFLHFIAVDYTGTTREIVAEWVQRTTKHSEVRILLPHNALQTDLNIFTTTGRHVISMDIQGEETRNFFPWCPTFQPTRNMKKNIQHFEQFYDPVNGIGNIKGIRSLGNQAQNQQQSWVCCSNVAAEATYYRFVQQAQKRMRENALAAQKQNSSNTVPDPTSHSSGFPPTREVTLNPVAPPHSTRGPQLQPPAPAVQMPQGSGATPAYLPSHYPQYGPQQNWMVNWPQPAHSNDEQSRYVATASFNQDIHHSAFKPYNPTQSADRPPIQPPVPENKEGPESRDVLKELTRKQHMEMIAKKLAQPLQKRKVPTTMPNPGNLEVLATFGPGEPKSSRTDYEEDTPQTVSPQSPRSRRKPPQAHVHRRVAPSTNTSMPPPAHQSAWLPSQQTPQLAGMLTEREDSPPTPRYTDGQDSAVPLLARAVNTQQGNEASSPIINVVDSEEDEAFHTADDNSTVSTKVKLHSATAPGLGISVGQGIEENPLPTHHQAIAQYSLVAPLTNLQMVQLSKIRNVRSIPHEYSSIKQRPPTPIPNRINVKPIKPTATKNLWEDLGRKLKINIPSLGFKGTATVKENKSLRVCVPSKEKARADTHLGKLHTLVQDIVPKSAPTPNNSPNTPIHID